MKRLLCCMIVIMSIAANGQSLKTVNVTATFYPVYIFAKNITKGVEGVYLRSLTPLDGGCLHDYQITPENEKMIGYTDILITQGNGMEQFVERASKVNRKMKIIEAGRGIDLLKERSGEENTHVWVGMKNAIKEVKNITDRLVILDPQNKNRYRANADEYIARLEALRGKMQRETELFRKKDFVDFHGAFRYFAKEFDLNIVEIIEKEPGVEPSAAEIERIEGTIRKRNIRAVFYEPQYISKAAEKIAADTGVKLLLLDPAATGRDEEEGFERAMIKNLETLKMALGE